jgi:hypothetical protein
MMFPPEPPMATITLPERRGAVKDAPLSGRAAFWLDAAGRSPPLVRRLNSLLA